MSHEVVTEKYNFFYAVRDIDKMLERMSQSAKSPTNYRSELRRLRPAEFSRLKSEKSMRKLAYRDEWIKFEKLYSQLDRMLKGQSSSAERTMASDPAVRLRVDVKRLRGQVGKLSIW